ncbi:MAG: DUF1836 domain-containing protein, partial [Clostridiales bacterium]|nr:DUF1836 domain-containing protein [Clostridiales bacterium]
IMEDLKEKLQKAGMEIERINIPSWEEMPQLELYMDQVIMLLNQYFGVDNEESDKKEAITKNMINNYVKMKVVPPPVKKRYSKKHLVYLVLVCLMKQTFSIATIKSILPDFEDEGSLKEIYNSYVKYYKNTAKEVVEKYSAIEYKNISDAVIRMGTESIILKELAERALS